jgi:hypothetical protein
VSLEQTLLEREEAFWREAGNGDFYRENLIDEALMVFPAPYGVMDKAATVQAVQASPAWRRFELRNPRVVELTDDSATLVYHADALDAAGSRYSAYVTSVYVHREGAWRLALHHQTPIAAP